MSAPAEQILANDSRFINQFTPKELKRFWGFSGKTNDCDCWNWQAAKLPFGYGVLKISRGSRKLQIMAKAHRISWMIHFGMIPEHLCVCHKCDNPSCVNPKHLFIGTIQENNKDKQKKCRQKSPCGEQHGMCKFSDEKASEIKAEAVLGHMTQREIAKKHGCCQQYVSQIKTGRNRFHS